MSLTVSEWEALDQLRSEVDAALEAALVDQSSVAEACSAVLRIATRALQLRGGFVQTYGEEAALILVALGELPEAAAWACAHDGTLGPVAERHDLRTAEGMCALRAIDVVGRWFGWICFAHDAKPLSQLAERALEAVAEQLDNFLYGIYAARQKHSVMMEVGRALRHRVIGDGIQTAVTVLTANIGLADIVLVFQAEENVAERLVVQCYRSGVLVHDTLRDHDTVLKELGQRYLANGDAEMLRHLGVEGSHEELLINGVTRSTLVGKIVATSKSGAFNTFGRELLGNFAAVIRQRVVDFNKEWRALAASFRAADVARLLSAEDYATRYLSPREAHVCVLYIDIAGFTRLSETQLRTPEKVANFVELWSKHAVDIIWAEGGVFDKMVGDCIIALFGPPFFDKPSADYVAAALRSAVAVRSMTEQLPEELAIPELRGSGVTVSTGINHAPLFVGTFGPNQNFTGFSSGMNNAARLQGLAAPGEILAMQSVVELAAASFAFGPKQEGKVKNVAEPLQFCALLAATSTAT